MKVKTSVTDIPYAIEDARLPADFGYNLSDQERGQGKGLMTKRNSGICLAGIARRN
jgi:hypothetical protein